MASISESDMFVDVVVPEWSPIVLRFGIELSDKLFIVGFIRDEDGNLPKWLIEADLKVGDELIYVNGEKIREPDGTGWMPSGPGSYSNEPRMFRFRRSSRFVALDECSDFGDKSTQDKTYLWTNKSKFDFRKKNF